MAGSGAEAAADEGARPKLHHRARGFVKNRSGKQKLTGLAAVALLVTAPFGGLRAEPEPTPAPLRLGHRIDLGPIEVTIQKVVSIGSLSESIRPERDDDRLLVVEAVLRNRTDEPQVANQLADAFYGRRVGIPVPGIKTRGTTYFVEDGSLLSGYLNPGVSYRVAVVFEQQGDWTPGTGKDRPLLGLNDYGRSSDIGGLDPDAWVVSRPLVEGLVDVEVKQ